MLVRETRSVVVVGTNKRSNKQKAKVQKESGHILVLDPSTCRMYRKELVTGPTKPWSLVPLWCVCVSNNSHGKGTWIDMDCYSDLLSLPIHDRPNPAARDISLPEKINHGSGLPYAWKVNVPLQTASLTSWLQRSINVPLCRVGRIQLASYSSAENGQSNDQD